jgi:hypothetical protein
MPNLGNLDSEMAFRTRDFQPRRTKDILVLSVAGNKDSAAALNMEKKLANRLKSYNYFAQSAIEYFGQNAFAKVREEETIKQLYPYDAVIIIALINENQKTGLASECNDFFWEYYDGVYSATHDPVVKKAGKDYWEISFFGISNWKLEYRMKTLAFPNSQTKALVASLGKSIIGDMIKKQVIHPLPTNLKPF